MKVIKRFVCEKCKTDYSTKELALACEEKHALPVAVFPIKSYRYTHDENRLHYIPNRIIVKMSDGRFFTYDDPVPTNDFEIPNEAKGEENNESKGNRRKSSKQD